MIGSNTNARSLEMKVVIEEGIVEKCKKMIETDLTRVGNRRNRTVVYRSLYIH